MFAIRQAWSPDDLDPVPGLLGDLVVVFAAFCALSGAVYLFNDLADREVDRQHPVKRHRPIASGKVAVPVAVTAMLTLTTVGPSRDFFWWNLCWGVSASSMLVSTFPTPWE